MEIIELRGSCRIFPMFYSEMTTRLVVGMMFKMAGIDCWLSLALCLHEF